MGGLQLWRLIVAACNWVLVSTGLAAFSTFAGVLVLRRELWLTLVDDNEDAGGGGGYRADGGMWVRPASAEQPVA